MKCYISGKISGLPIEQVFDKFRQAEMQVRALGYEPVNPLNNGVDRNASWNAHIVADIAMLLECDAIFLLSDWHDSKGARIEKVIAEECGLKSLLQFVL